MIFQNKSLLSAGIIRSWCRRKLIRWDLVSSSSGILSSPITKSQKLAKNFSTDILVDFLFNSNWVSHWFSTFQTIITKKCGFFGKLTCKIVSHFKYTLVYLSQFESENQNLCDFGFLDSTFYSIIRIYIPFLKRSLAKLLYT